MTPPSRAPGRNSPQSEWAIAEGATLRAAIGVQRNEPSSSLKVMRVAWMPSKLGLVQLAVAAAEDNQAAPVPNRYRPAAAPKTRDLIVSVAS